MSFWYDIKNKNYSSDGKGSWLRAYADRIVNVLRSDCDTKFSEHFEGTLGRHKAADVDCDNGNTVQQNLDSEREERLAEDEAIRAELATESEAIRAEIATESDEIRAEMQSGDNALSTEISNLNTDLKQEIADETEARKAAVEAEASTRASAISSEASTRESADTSLQTQINGKAPTSHAVSATTYGVGTSANYGHLKIADNLTTTTSGTALAANQGKVLNEKVDALPIKSLEGQEVTTDSSTTVTASTVPIIIGDLRRRTYNSSTGYADTGNVASGTYSIAMGCGTTASGHYSVAMGLRTTASGSCSTAMGKETTASGVYSYSTAMGYGTTASGDYSTAMGQDTTASGDSSIAMGFRTTASGGNSTAMGKGTTASGYSSIAMGQETTASGNYSTAMGYGTTAEKYQMAIGTYNTEGTARTNVMTKQGDAFIIGNGTAEDSTSNAFRVTYTGAVYGAGAYTSSGADIAELYEWQDGNPDNEDRRGLFVTLDGTKIRPATPEDTYIKGVISARPCLVGDSSSEDWQGKYLTDIFGEKLTEIVHYDAEYEEVEKIDEETGEVTTERVMISDEYDVVQWVLNPEYDPEKEYIPREERPEYDYVSSWGKIVLVDDGSCEENGFATVGEGGKATKSDTQTMYRVMERKDDTHIYVAVG